jgi:hypothetical protein
MQRYLDVSLFFRVSAFTVNYLRHLLGVLALVFCFAACKPIDCQWHDLDRTATPSGAYLAMVRLQDCWDHQNYSIRIELPDKWFIDLDLENETDRNEDEPTIKWTEPLTLEVIVRTATLKGTIERKMTDYDSPNRPTITVVRRYIPR